MRYVINTIDGTITDVAGTVIVDTDLMTPEQYDSFIDMDDADLIEIAKTIGVPV